MIPLRNITNINRKTKQGDWTCLQCSNYNYSFRDICNRCRTMTKLTNNQVYTTLIDSNFGDKSFPTAVFISLDGIKDNSSSIKQNHEEVLSDHWIDFLIGK